MVATQFLVASLVAAASATSLVAREDAFFTSLLKRQEPGTPAYECHEDCGTAITLSRGADPCNDASFVSDYNSCLQCSGPDKFNIWRYYGNTLSVAGAKCGLDTAPGGGAAPSATPAPTSAAAQSSAAPPAAPSSAPAPSSAAAPSSSEAAATTEAPATSEAPVSSDATPSAPLTTVVTPELSSTAVSSAPISSAPISSTLISSALISSAPVSSTPPYPTFIANGTLSSSVSGAASPSTNASASFSASAPAEVTANAAAGVRVADAAGVFGAIFVGALLGM